MCYEGLNNWLRLKDGGKWSRVSTVQPSLMDASLITWNHTCAYRPFWVGLIFEVSDSVFYRSRSNIDIGNTAEHMRNFSNKSNVTPLISDDCSYRPAGKGCGVKPGWTNDTR